MPIDDHNGAQWLTVRHEETPRGPGFLPGWYVVRTCPCHSGERVTLPQDNEAEAQRVRRVIEACDRHGIAMLFTGVRHFRH